MNFDQTLANARGIGVLSGEEIEREYVRGVNSRPLPRCDAGHAVVYSHAVGACRCEFGAIVRRNGSVVRPCPAR
jgi:hypothetical protein